MYTAIFGYVECRIDIMQQPLRHIEVFILGDVL